MENAVDYIHHLEHLAICKKQCIGCTKMVYNVTLKMLCQCMAKEGIEATVRSMDGYFKYHGFQTLSACNSMPILKMPFA